MIALLRWLSYFFLTLLLLLGLILASLSWTVPALTERFLLNKGYAIDFDKVRINPLRGAANFSGVSLREADASSTAQAIELSSFEIKVQPLPLLLERRVVVNPLTLDGLRLTLEKSPEGYRVNGFPHELLKSNAENQNPDSAEDSGDSVEFSVQNLSLANVTVGVSSSDKPEETLTVRLVQLAIDNVDSLQRGSNSAVLLNLSVDNIGLNTEGDISLLASEPEASLTVGVTQLDSETIRRTIELLPDNEPLIAALAPIQFNADVASKLKLLLKEQPVVKLDDFSLDIRESRYQIETPAGDDAGQQLAFSGTLGAKHAKLDPTAGYILEALRVEDATIDFISGSSQPQSDASESEPAADITLSKLNFNMDQASYPQVSKSQFNLDSEVGKFGKLTADGALTVADFAESTQIKLKGEQLDLVPLSPAARQVIDRGIKSGLLSIDSEIAIAKRQLDASNAIRVDQLKLAGINSDGGEPGDALQLGMPLNTALNLLKDKNDRIELKFPVDGSIDDPSFGLAPVIQKALAKSITSAVTTKLGPLLALSALSKARDLGDALRLKPVTFEAGSAQINDEGAERIKKLADFLDQRRAVSITVCPYAVVADGPIPSPAPAGEQKKPVLNATQKALSEERLESIKASLLSQGIDGQRIVPCATELDNGEEAKPRVSFSF